MKLTRFVSLFVALVLGFGFMASTVAAEETVVSEGNAAAVQVEPDVIIVPSTNGGEGGEAVDPDGPTQPAGPSTPIGTTLPGSTGPQQATPGSLTQPTVPGGPSIVATPQENGGGDPVDPVDPGPTNPGAGGSFGGGGSSSGGSSGTGTIVPVVPFTAAQIEALRQQALALLSQVSAQQSAGAAGTGIARANSVETEAAVTPEATDANTSTDANSNGSANTAAAASAIDGSSFFSKLWSGIVTVVTYIPKKVWSLFN